MSASECEAHEHPEEHRAQTAAHDSMVHVGLQTTVQAQSESECPHCPMQNCAFQLACMAGAATTAEVVETGLPNLSLGDRVLIFAPTVVLHSVADQRSTPPPRQNS